MESKGPVSGVGLTFETGQAVPSAPQTIRIAVLADLNGSGQATSASLTPDNDFDAFLETISPQVSLFIDPSPIDTPQPLEAHLRIQSIQDLSPAGVIAQVPCLTALVLFRQRLDLFHAGELSESELSADLDAYRAFPELSRPLALWDTVTTTAARPGVGGPGRSSPGKVGARDSKEASLDQVFDMLDPARGGAPPDTVAGRTVGQALTGIVKGHGRPRIDVQPVRKATTDTINALLDAIFHHPDFQRIEATVRGLRFLRRRVREGYEVVVVDAGNRDLPDAFRRHIHAPQMTASTPSPVDLALIEPPIRRTAAHLEMLKELATLAEESQVPTIVGLATDFLEAEDGPPSSVRLLGDHPAFLPWQALRQKDCARWIVATFNPFLLRSPYSQSSSRGMEYDEEAAAPQDLLWGQSGWLILERLLAVAAAHSWPVGFEGRSAGCVEGLELHEGPGDMQIPLRYPLGPENVLDIAELGIAVPACEPNRDRAYILSVPVLFEAPRLADAAQDRQVRRMARLDFQLVAARLSRLLDAFLPDLQAETTPAAKAARLRSLILARVAETGRDADVSVTPSTSEDGRAEVVVRLGGGALDGIPVMLQVPF